MTDVFIDKNHRIYYDPDLELVTIENIYRKTNIHLSETAVLKMLEHMLIYGMKSKINVETIRTEIGYREKIQDKKERLEEYIKKRIHEDYIEDIPNRMFINIHTKEKVHIEEVKRRIHEEIEYISKLI